MIGQHQRHHRFDHGHATNADAGVMPPLGDDVRCSTIARDRFDRDQDGTGGLERHAQLDRLTGRDTARNAACMIGEEYGSIFARPHRIGILFAAQAGGGKTIANLDALDRIDAHHRTRQFAVELGIKRRAPAGRHARGDAFDHGTQRGAIEARRIDQLFPPHSGLRVRAEEGVLPDQRRIEMRIVYRVAANGADIGENIHFGDDRARHRARRHPACGFPRRRTPAAAIVAKSIFGVIGIVGMAGTIGLGDVRIIFRSLVGIFDHQADRRAGRPPFKHARQDADLVRLAPLGGEFGRAGLAQVEPGLDVGLAQVQPRRTAIDDRADGRTMALAPGGEAEYATETVETHSAASLSQSEPKRCAI